MKRCPECGRKYPDEALYCSLDAAELEEVRPAPRDPLVGRELLSRYRVLELLGRGGFGTVYRVENLGLGRPEALKILHFRALEDLQLSEREQRQYANWLRSDFLRERSALVRLEMVRCPYIAGIYDGGVLPAELIEKSEDRPFFTMEFVEGEALLELVVREGGLPLERALPLLRQVCEALHVAHSLEIPPEEGGGEARVGIVHRDLKLENVMVARFAGEERAKVVDFGVGKVVGAPKTDRSLHVSVFTPGCAAPEQMEGEATPSVDLFALGVLAYELLSGHEPWRGRSLRDGRRLSQGEARSLLLTAPRLEPAPLARFRPDLPSHLVDLVHRLLEKRPEDRPPSAQAVRERLEGIEPTTSGTSRPASTLQVTSEPDGVGIVVLGDGKILRKDTTPLVFGDLPAGSYRVDVRDWRYQKARSQVRVPAGREVHLQLTPERRGWATPRAAGFLGILGAVAVSVVLWLQPGSAPPPDHVPPGTVTSGAVMTDSMESPVREAGDGIDDDGVEQEGDASPGPATSPPELVSLEIQPASLTLEVGETRQLSPRAVYSDQTTSADLPVTWTSLNPLIASVSTGGRVEGRAAGRTSIAARFEGRQTSVTVTVRDARGAAADERRRLGDQAYEMAERGVRRIGTVTGDEQLAAQDSIEAGLSEARRHYEACLQMRPVDQRCRSSLNAVQRIYQKDELEPPRPTGSAVTMGSVELEHNLTVPGREGWGPAMAVVVDFSLHDFAASDQLCVIGYFHSEGRPMAAPERRGPFTLTGNSGTFMEMPARPNSRYQDIRLSPFFYQFFHVAPGRHDLEVQVKVWAGGCTHEDDFERAVRGESPLAVSRPVSFCFARGEGYRCG